MAKTGGLHKGYRNIPISKSFKNDKKDTKRLHSLQQNKRKRREEESSWRSIPNKRASGEKGKAG